MSEEKKSVRSGQEIIALRDNWLKIFVTVTVTAVLSVKFWLADFSQAFASFDFSDLLALFLALFSIALSVLFYLKATETSNVFYDNTYRFTKEVAEILGRVEAGFGEKLAHLDEGYSGLRTAVENIPFDRAQAQKDIEEDEQEVERVEAEREQLIESILERARLDSEEKEGLRRQLQSKDRELIGARRELSDARRQMVRALEEERLFDSRQSLFLDHRDFALPTSVRRRFLAATKSIPTEALRDLSLEDLNNRWKRIRGARPSHNSWKELGLVDEEGGITDFGLHFIRRHRAAEVAL